MTDGQPISINPFADDIVSDPRRVEYSVPGLNDSVAAQITSGIEALCLPAKPRLTARSAKALFVTSRRAGFGKSHLIGTVFRRLSGKATLVNVRPFEDPATRWKSILDRIVQELDFPDRYTRSDSDHATQLELFAHGTLSQIVADYLETTNGDKSQIAVLRRPADQLTKLKRHQNWRDYIENAIRSGTWLSTVERPLKAAGFRLNTPLATWLRVLYSYAYCDDDWDVRRSCLDWLQADAIEDETAEVIGVRRADRVSPDQTAGELNELAKARVLDLCRLAGFFRPFLICLDQTETYGKSEELARCLGTVITDLVDEGSNHLTVMTANIDPWEKHLRTHWQQASLDRLAQPYMVLEGIGLQQGRELAEQRLGMLDVDRAKRNRFWGDSRWLEECFASRELISVREFLHDCSRRWAACIEEPSGDPAPPATESVALASLFEKYIDAVSAKPRRLVFDRDTFHWLVHELAAGLDSLEVGTLDDPQRGEMPRWRYADKEFVFGFESGTHWKRWHNIARTALRGAESGRIMVYLRTPELSRIPKPTWKVAKADIDKARKGSLLILELSRHEVIVLYAAQELYADALQGDIDRGADEVVEFLRERLSDFWQSILEWRGQGDERAAAGRRAETGQRAARGKRAATSQRTETRQPAAARQRSGRRATPKPKKPETPPPSATPPPNGSTGSHAEDGDDDLRNRVIDAIRASRFLSLDELLESLPGDADREAVLAICGEKANIRVHAHPTMTVLQWQHG